MASSVEFQVDNAVSIPYHDGLWLGHAVDFAKQLGKGRKIVTDENACVTSKVNHLTCKFAMTTSLNHVCEVLDIPYGYALKVEAGLLQNAVVKACLHNFYNRQAFKVIFRLRFIQEKQHFFSPISFFGENSSQKPVNYPAEQFISDLRINEHDTHAVDSLQIGDELVVIMTISASEPDALQTFRNKTEQLLGKRSGPLGEDMIPTLETLADSLDNKLSKSHYKDVKCAIEYGSFVDLNTYPSDVSGMVKVIKSFRKKWIDMIPKNATVNSQVTATDMKVRKGIAKKVEDVLQVQPEELYYLRATLQPNCEEDKANIWGSLDYSLKIYENLFTCLVAVNKTESLIQSFLAQHSLFSNQDYKLKGEEICIQMLRNRNQVVDVIEGLTMVDLVSENDVQSLKNTLKEQTDLVDDFIQNVTTKLPSGEDINLLIIGKTGHGKSSTANAILSRNEFETSSGAISQTKTCQRGWACVDDRTLKVVDIPGVCDTDMNNLESVKLAMKCISEAITTCSEGFHALLFVIRYGIRMTEEEERAIYILKCILGSTILHSHGICIITHGDNFDENEGSFEDWCKKQEGFLKEVFEECNYRCVLFNNKSSDPSIQKTQLIELVSKVDCLEHRGSCYTNDIFKHAEQDRKRLIEEMQLPQFKEEIFKEMSLLQGEFKNIDIAVGDEKKAAMDKLKSKVEELKMKLEGVRSGRIADLFQAISSFSERLSRMEEKELADAQFHLEREKFRQEELRLKAEREEMERKIAEQTEQRIREAALAEQRRQSEIREQENKNREVSKHLEEELEKVKEEVANTYKKKSRWVTFRDSLFRW